MLGHDLDSWNEYIYESTEPGEWSDYGFSELPIEIQEAAEELGYDQKDWDDGKETKITKKKWNKLTADQQEAARRLGYDESTWE